MTFNNYCNHMDCKNCKYKEFMNNDSWCDCEAHWTEDHDIKTINEFTNYLCQKIPYTKLGIPKLIIKDFIEQEMEKFIERRIKNGF